MYSIGDRVRLNKQASENDNYANLLGSTLEVSHVATAYMPAAKFYAEGQPAGFHPGYDSSSGCALYCCENCPFSFYEWELESA